MITRFACVNMFASHAKRVKSFCVASLLCLVGGCHSAGDTVLAAVANVIRSQIDGMGFAARIGGEEVLLALPSAGKLAALTLARRIKAEVEGMVTKASAGREDLKVTLSIGVAIITPRWLYVLAAATPATWGDPLLTDETLEAFDPAKLEPGDVVGIGIHTANALRGYHVGRLARARGALADYDVMKARVLGADRTGQHLLGGLRARVPELGL